MNGHVYDCADASQVDQYTSMTKEIVLYLATNSKMNMMLGRSLKTLAFQQ